MTLTNTNHKYSALLGYFKKLEIAAMICDNTGLVICTNQIAAAVRQQTIYCCSDFCLNQVERQPANGRLVIYKDRQQHTHSATLVSTRLDAEGNQLLLFIEPQVEQLCALGFVLFDALTQDCYWSQRASRLHGEHRYQPKQSLAQLLRWYPPTQRDRLLYAILQCEHSHQPQQVSLEIAYSRKRIRYLWLTLPIQGKPVTCAFLRPLATAQQKHHLPHAMPGTKKALQQSMSLCL